ncbi:DUF805 domain-containing protein [Parasphingopyxis lamellibrachiae]|uniref:Uncharacterized membrane protein YhaH (DUF805 family) n=1 Tax=Parasphingopyxis lamellibrachiae TaxID=680125 RepID=A0A3D9FGG2_9SPHN|nr:DUF805 domain-containing protein [Parasphingopyxis lamellibrachiae]RED16206.1 uncharacterized membrane protein YhaH (DUF805 family) [Parasphingopyxis lamellibrachiae]
MEWMLMPLRRYADFEGRSRRLEYWMFYLFTLILGMAAGVVLLAIALLLYTMNFSESVMGMVLVPLYLVLFIGCMALLVPTLAVAVRRFHDQDKSGWMILLALIPFVGGIIFLVFMCLEGTPGPNRYGPDPVDDRERTG